MPITYYWANLALSSFFGGSIPSRTMYLRLSTTVPNASSSNWTEVTGAGYGGYAAQTLAEAVMSTPSSGGAASTAEVTFPTPSSGGATLQAVGLWDAASGGNLHAWSALVPPVLVVTSNSIRIPVGTLIAQNS